nr:hypothetical protein [Acidimicrobiia bacterium]
VPGGAPVLRPIAVPNKKAKKAGLDESAFTRRDDILDRLRQAEVAVEPDAAGDLLADPPPPVVVPAIDPALAERERRILERLAQHQPPPADH